MNKKKYIFFLVVLLSFFCKLQAMENNVYLKDIRIINNNLSPIFDKNITVYNLYTNLNRINIEIDKENEEDEVIYDNEIVLDKSKTIVNILVRNNDNEKNYILKIFKDYKENNENTLETLEIKGHKINYRKDIKEYVINAVNDDLLDIYYKVNNKNLNVLITGNNSNSDLINIRVINNKTKEIDNYKIKINRELKVFNENKENIKVKEKKNTKILFISIALSAFIILLIIFYLMFIKKRY